MYSILATLSAGTRLADHITFIVASTTLQAVLIM
jgi:hypothetical protein